MTLGVCGSAPEACSAKADLCVFGEIWVSLATLLRSYTALHARDGQPRALVEASAREIVVRHGKKRLSLVREGEIVTWTRENGRDGRLALTSAGRFSDGTREEELDMAAEAWARELMR